MSASTRRVLICDDHELIREGIKRVLIDGGICSRVEETGSAPEALAAVRRERWDLVMLDLNLGGRTGMEVLRAITAEFPRLPVLILSNYPEEQFALRTIQAGARGYLNKNLAKRVLVDAARQVLAGGRYLSPKVAEQLIGALQQPAAQPLHATLSDREDQVLRLIAIGHTVGEIAARLALSVKTVSTYRAIILRKLGLANNAQIMRYALDHRLNG